jgi:hypothetical protein
VFGGGKEQGRCTDVGSDRVRTFKPEIGDPVNDELCHSGRLEQVVSSLRVSEARQIDRYKMRVFGQTRPHLLKRIKALRPRAQ